MKESIFETILYSYPAALFFIYLGYRINKRTIKEVNKERTEYLYGFGDSILKGFASGIGLIVFGLLVIVFKLQGKI